MPKRSRLFVVAGIIIACLIGGVIAVVITQKTPQDDMVILKVRPKEDARKADAPKDMPTAPEEIVGDEAAPGHRTFENMLRDLMFVSLDDIKRGFLSSPIDVAAQRDHFTDDGWLQYQAYIAEQKITLRKRMDSFGPTPQSKGEIKDGTQEYTNLGDAVGFTGRVYFCFGSSDAYACDEEDYSLSIAFSGNIWTPSAIKIQEWKVTKE